MNKLLKANGSEMEKLRAINKYHPGFQKCVLEIAANSVVGISPGERNLRQQAIGYLERVKRSREELKRVRVEVHFESECAGNGKASSN